MRADLLDPAWFDVGEADTGLFPTQIEELILKIPDLAPIYQLVVSREGHLDKLEVNVEMRQHMSRGWKMDASAAAAHANELRHQIKALIGVSTTVNVLQPDSIERSVGKAKRVIDQRPKG